MRPRKTRKERTIRGGVDMEQQLVHHGILGQKWGVRRFQNRDGTLTSAGKQRKESEKKGLTDKQKKIIKGALIAAGAAAVVGGGIYLAKTGKLDKLTDKGKDFVKNKSQTL